MKLFSWLQDQSTEQTDDNSTKHPMAPALEARLTELEQLSVREAMIPRSVVKALDADVQLRRVRRLKSAKTQYFPVYKGDLDHILGWVTKQKVLELMNDPNEESGLEQHVRPAGEVDENATCAELADAFLKSGSPFLVVRNAQGATSGIVPLSEFVELLFGFELVPAEQLAPTELGTTPLRSYEI